MCAWFGGFLDAAPTCDNDGVKRDFALLQGNLPRVLSPRRQWALLGHAVRPGGSTAVHKVPTYLILFGSIYRVQ